MKIEAKLSRLQKSTLSETVTKVQLEEVDRRKNDALHDIDELDISKEYSDNSSDRPVETSFTKTYTKITKEVENNYIKMKIEQK